jgi:hypothetical protein
MFLASVFSRQSCSPRARRGTGRFAVVDRFVEAGIQPPRDGGFRLMCTGSALSVLAPVRSEALRRSLEASFNDSSTRAFGSPSKGSSASSYLWYRVAHTGTCNALKRNPPKSGGRGNTSVDIHDSRRGPRACRRTRGDAADTVTDARLVRRRGDIQLGLKRDSSDGVEANTETGEVQTGVSSKTASSRLGRRLDHSRWWSTNRTPKSSPVCH